MESARPNQKPDEVHAADEQRSGLSGEPSETELIETLRRENQELRDKNLRLIAEQRNVQQRAEREKSEALRYAEADFARELLVILDDFDRTVDSARTATSPQVVAEGVRIVQDHMVKLLRSRQIEPIEADGRPFDPNQHEALMQQPHDDVPAGHVLRELARGYRMHDRVLRPTKVIISTGAGATGQQKDTDKKTGKDGE